MAAAEAAEEAAAATVVVVQSSLEVEVSSPEDGDGERAQWKRRRPKSRPKVSVTAMEPPLEPPSLTVTCGGGQSRAPR